MAGIPRAATESAETLCMRIIDKVAVAVRWDKVDGDMVKCLERRRSVRWPEEEPPGLAHPAMHVEARLLQRQRQRQRSVIGRLMVG